MSLEDVLIPLAFATLIAILLNPLCNRLQRKMPKVIAIMVTMLIAIVVLVSLFYFLSSRIAHFFDDLDAIKLKFGQLLHHLQSWLSDTFGLTIKKQDANVK